MSEAAVYSGIGKRRHGSSTRQGRIAKQRQKAAKKAAKTTGARAAQGRPREWKKRQKETAR